MKLKAPIVEIPQANPFQNDLLNRKESADLLTEMIRSTDEALVLCINAAWGQGKTTFLAMWRQQLSNAGFKTLYFSAWESDFTNDALVSLIGELELGIKDLVPATKDQKSAAQQLNRVKKLAATLARKSIPTAIKVVTAGAVNLDDFTEEALSSLTEKLAEDEIKHYEASKNTVAGFKRELSQFAQAAAIAASGDDKGLIIFVDELDRCRPPYAIDVLERVKHFFSVPNVIFVLAVDKAQLGHSIRTQYGQGMDVDGYLRRFIDVEYNLPPPEEGAFCRSQFVRFGLKEFFDSRRGRESQHDFDQFEELFTELSVSFDLTLREQEHCFALLSMAIRVTTENQLLFPPLLATLILLKVKNSELYRHFVSGRCKLDEVLTYLSSTLRGKALMSSRQGARIEAYLVAFGNPGVDQTTLIAPYQKILQDTSTGASERDRVEGIFRFLTSPERRRGDKVLQYVAGKIDLVARFVK